MPQVPPPPHVPPASMHNPTRARKGRGGGQQVAQRPEMGAGTGWGL